MAKQIVLHIVCLLVLSLSSFGQRVYFDSLAVANAKVTNLESINSENADYSPVLWRDLLVFVTNDRDDADYHKEIKQRFYDLKYTTRTEPYRAAYFSPVINSPFHEGPCDFTADGGELFFTQDNNKDGKLITNADNVATLQIYTSIFGKGGWSEPKKWMHSDGKFSYAHPTLSQSGDTLIFASNKVGGEGKMDLYLSIYEGGIWTAPTPLSSKINNDANQVFPRLTDGIIYYASDHDTEGTHLDIYGYDVANDSVFTLPEPINSRFDDFGYYPIDDTSAYFASNRPNGQGKDDIYLVESAYPLVQDGVKLTPHTYVKVVDNTTHNLVSGAEFNICYLRDKESIIKLLTQNAIKDKEYDDLKADFDTEITQVTSDKGLLDIEVAAPALLMIEGNNATFEPYHEIIYVDNHDTLTIELVQEKIVTAPTVRRTTTSTPTRRPVVINKQVVQKGSVLVFDNIYYDYNSAIITAGSTAELDELARAMSANPRMTVQLSAHTDARGKTLYNQQLSDKRAEAAKQYLVTKGIRSNRITAIGFGESRIRNHCQEGVTCTEDEHRFNRRTEVKVVGY